MQQADKGVRPLFGLGGDSHGVKKLHVLLSIYLPCKSVFLAETSNEVLQSDELLIVVVVVVVVVVAILAKFSGS